ncbi:response regulator transcription factor [Paenibacillus sp. UMB7766-LJ446]|uniref:response regulator transcription factor n=1 Tax=Paenibacillus sp. UMB7766-LJ446 TaxID=3046313 RepID=UPI00254A0724|nr:response regulator transcription factor [Paenibacillus sp. UMB7766-LJ446]MDK8193081.1 response regulator transcription factor [Paenibacillus sp. UMB7766-LJ446]
MLNRSLKQKQILIIDQNWRIREKLRIVLEEENYVVDEAEEGLQALSKFQMHHYELIILDSLLPDICGIELCRLFRYRGNIPIIVLSSQPNEHEIIKAFQVGVDDYVKKPCSIREVILRVKNILGRFKNSFEHEGIQKSCIEIGKLQISPEFRKVTYEGRTIYLSPMEYGLLYFLSLNRGRAYTREELLNEVWGDKKIDVRDSRTVDTHIKRLRGKLSPEQEELINTLWGYGYIIK